MTAAVFDEAVFDDAIFDDSAFDGSPIGAEIIIDSTIVTDFTIESTIDTIT
jgi:hypothetical protein